jgi:DNA adenine methylase
MSMKPRRSNSTRGNSLRSRSQSDRTVYRVRRSLRQSYEIPIEGPQDKGGHLNEVAQGTLPDITVASILPEAQPFLKWAGGKSQLLGQLDPFFPESITTYCEPFIGGGAVFFHLKAQFPHMHTAIRDNNPELINCYIAVRDQVKALMTSLDEHLRQFRQTGEQYYYLVRSQHHLTDLLARASRMIFLNKTCYNGLWRVNARAEFNVPMGSYRPEKVSLYDQANLLAASRALQGADLAVEDFRETLRTVPAETFVYVDPPYFPISATANFTSYTKEEFGREAQEELAALFADASHRGVRLMLSNSDTPFVRDLYKGFKLHTVKARRAVNCDGKKRGLISEVLVLSLFA